MKKRAAAVDNEIKDRKSEMKSKFEKLTGVSFLISLSFVGYFMNLNNLTK